MSDESTPRAPEDAQMDPERAKKLVAKTKAAADEKAAKAKAKADAKAAKAKSAEDAKAAKTKAAADAKAAKTDKAYLPLQAVHRMRGSGAALPKITN